MGQANSKKSKKGSKDREGGGEKDAENGTSDAGAASESVPSSSSNGLDENASQAIGVHRDAR